MYGYSHTYMHVCLQTNMIAVSLDFHISWISGIPKLQKYGNTRKMEVLSLPCMRLCVSFFIEHSTSLCLYAYLLIHMNI